MLSSSSPVPGSDQWAGGDAYEYFMGRWSALVAARFLAWLDAPPDRRWLDIGCGTGTLARAIQAGARPSALLACDLSAAFVDHARRHDRGGAGFFTADARALPLAAQQADLAVSGIMLNFVSQPQSALAELIRVTRRGGWVAMYVWDYAGEMEMLRLFWETAVKLDPNAARHDERQRFPLCRPGALATLLRAGSLRQVQETGLVVTCRFRDFDDYWEPFLGGTGPAPAYVSTLSAARRGALAAALRRRLPSAAAGTITLRARAWAAAGQIAA